MTLLAGQNDRSIDYLGGDRPGTVAARALYALRERVRVREHRHASEATVEGCPVRHLPFTLNQDAVVPAVPAYGALKARVVVIVELQPIAGMTAVALSGSR
jgi:hypothetical protein